MKKLKIFTLIGLALFLSGCTINNVFNKNVSQPRTNENINQPINVGGGCQYSSMVGTVKILSIEPAPTNRYNCPQDPKVVKFQFTPDDMSAKNNYKFPNTSDIGEMTINAGMNPSSKWLDANNVAVGEIYKAERLEIINGACTPVSFKFSEIDLFPKTGCN